ncbi:inner membrane protein [Escherichia coli]|uniref:Inner membrane protein n=1 Tax=Escherichia coli TaxID=562 RepID=A0A485JAL5_ECOLX|nr:inner membrane protein [Escherichia coli]
MFLDYFALGVLIFVFLVIFYGIIILHDIPYLIAKKRNHPHADAIHVAGWVSLFTLHVIWPFLWIWATLYRPERGWGMQNHDSSVVQLQQRIAGWRNSSPTSNPLLPSNTYGFTDYFDLCGFRMGNV